MKTNYGISQKDLHLKPLSMWKFLPAVFLIYWVVPLFFLVDVAVAIYQTTYFSLVRIPKIKRSDFVMFDRWDLTKLSLLEKINCVYCEYANGVIAWAKAVVNQTELYSCAIKHERKGKGQEHQATFYEYSEFK